MTDDIKLPPFPDTIAKLPIDGDGSGPLIWKDDEVRAYARAAVEADRREYLDTLKLAREIVNGHRRGNPPEEAKVEADRHNQVLSDDERGTPDPIAGFPRAKSISDEMMDLVDRLGSEYDEVDPRAWEHLLVYAPKPSRYGSSQPTISDAQLQCILQVYDDALDKAREGREFDNPGRPGSLEARAWDAGTQRGKELGPISQPAASAEVDAWRERFPAHEYRPQDECVSLKLSAPAASAKPWKECRHCGWECRPNKSETGWKPLAAPVAQEPPQVTDVEIEKIVTELGARWDGSIWKVEDADLHPMARALLYRDTAAPVAAQPRVTDEMVTRFLGWHLPQDFAPDAGISFSRSPDPLCWPVGTNLLTDPQARAMLEYVLTGVKK